MKCIYRGRRRTCSLRDRPAGPARDQRDQQNQQNSTGPAAFSDRPAGPSERPAEFSRIQQKPRPATHDSASGAFGRLDQRNSPGLSRYQPESAGAAALSRGVTIP